MSKSVKWIDFDRLHIPEDALRAIQDRGPYADVFIADVAEPFIIRSEQGMESVTDYLVEHEVMTGSGPDDDQSMALTEWHQLCDALSVHPSSDPTTAVSAALSLQRMCRAYQRANAEALRHDEFIQRQLDQARAVSSDLKRDIEVYKERIRELTAEAVDLIETGTGQPADAD